jgi:hypothetical protein
MKRSKDAGLKETGDLLRLPKNKERLPQALREAKEYKGPGESVEELRRRFGLGEANPRGLGAE